VYLLRDGEEVLIGGVVEGELPLAFPALQDGAP